MLRKKNVAFVCLGFKHQVTLFRLKVNFIYKFYVKINIYGKPKTFFIVETVEHEL